MSRVPVAILGSGNIGTDLLFKIKRHSSTLTAIAMVGVDPNSDGLGRARRLGLATTADGIDGLLALPEFGPARVLLDATSAGAHARHAEVAAKHDKLMIDLTPAAIGPHVVPPVNLDQHRDATNLNMVTCGGQATIPVVAAVSRVTPVAYAEIVASIASRSAGPGTRANIDEFTETTARAIETVGGARHGKAVIVLNPAEPPIVMRDTVYCFVADSTDLALREAIRRSIEAMVGDVHGYVPGYRLKQAVQFDPVDIPYLPALDGPFRGLRVSVFLEVTGAGHYLPAYAGNLDIMTSAAVRAAERMSELRGWVTG
ncbi:acetaldehyde dehydrogenase (acetylating) [Solwaraspora sp. WMMD1047]|uniref:acetaldehyde dehydrogenase (acetylating) n=1 Tax=Solwaraspora sp. WMMD1047 TaxID=3016102 RepID=UPI002416B271|nr:acetaldehyde dehydrogenase (acetylating) [Solwaraspora sp. WMMD1047]MDG4830575.1 acetaldehyde dehydrogenase (acetylating) [Solwaraspora sp. WMMD1047]